MDRHLQLQLVNETFQYVLLSVPCHHSKSLPSQLQSMDERLHSTVEFFWVHSTDTCCVVLLAWPCEQESVLILRAPTTFKSLTSSTKYINFCRVTLGGWGVAWGWGTKVLWGLGRCVRVLCLQSPAYLQYICLVWSWNWRLGGVGWGGKKLRQAGACRQGSVELQSMKSMVWVGVG